MIQLETASAAHPEPSVERAAVMFPARDGWPLSMRRVRVAGVPARAAVVLQHGLGSNGLVFDYPGRSLAERLARAGFDCFIPELRGANRERRPKQYGLDDYLEHDVPAVLETARQISTRDRVHWVGHSLGGILLMLHAIEQPDAPVDRFVAVGSCLDYRVGKSVYRGLRRLRGLFNWLPSVPFDSLAGLNARCAGYGPKLLPEKMNFWRENIEPEIMRAIMQRGFTTIPMRLLFDLDSTFSPKGLCRKAGELEYLTHAHAFRLPACLIVGSRDEQCCEAAVDATARLLSNAAELRVARFGRAHGQANDYGHFDLLIGRHARSEVWPTIRAFLS
jgi:predicted alpha/beta hydrolase